MVGDILFFDDAGWTNALIKAVTFGPYNHCAIVASAHTMLNALAGEGTVESPLRSGGTLVATADRCPNLETALAWARVQKGDGYDYQDVLEIGWYSLFPSLKKPIVPDETTVYTCSELCGYFLLRAGFPFRQARSFNDMEYVSPNLLYRWLLNSRVPLG